MPPVEVETDVTEKTAAVPYQTMAELVKRPASDPWSFQEAAYSDEADAYREQNGGW
jgi:hypothetical protein